MSAGQDDTIALLEAARTGDADARNRVFERVFADLRGVAGRRLADEKDPPTSPTGLINRVVVKLAEGGRLDFHNRAELFAVFAMEMRRILIDEARRRRERTIMNTAELFEPDPFERFLELDEMLKRLRRTDDRAARVAELHWFGGLSSDVIAELHGVSERTVRRDLEVARTWLTRDQSDERA